MIAATWLACLFLGGLSDVPADLLLAIANGPMVAILVMRLSSPG